MALTSGARLGPYEIVSPLGAGGMGEVYRARDTRLDRTVAIKILPSHLSGDPTLRQRFEREAKAISSLNHPHICLLHDVGNQDGTDFLVMECVEGEALAKRVEKGPLPLEQVLKYGTQIADALDKAHRSGVVHRDLKPGNIMLTASGAKLLDFGLAKAAPPLAAGATLTAAATRTTPVTQQGTVVGTFQYLSPEQVEGKDLDARSDIFSFGSVLYEMVTGRRASPGKSQLSVASAVLEKDPEPMSTLQPLTPPALDRTIRVCLAKDPEDRWQTARDLLLELKWIAEAGSQAGRLGSSSLASQVARAAGLGGSGGLCTKHHRIGHRFGPARAEIRAVDAPERGDRRGRILVDLVRAFRDPFARRHATGFCRQRPRSEAPTVRPPARSVAGLCTSGHGKCPRSFLFTEWRVDRFFRRWQAEENFCPGRSCVHAL